MTVQGEDVLTGGCLCGAIRYRAVAGPRLHYVCHCTDCQRHGGGAFHAAIVVAATDVTFEATPRVWAKTAESGREVARYFCNECGGHVCTSPWPEATRFSLKAGTLDDPGLFKPAHEIWCQSEVPWITVPGKTDCYDQGFTDPVDIGGVRPVG